MQFALQLPQSPGPANTAHIGRKSINLPRSQTLLPRLFFRHLHFRSPSSGQGS
jgi:hypothetical protein